MNQFQKSLKNKGLAFVEERSGKWKIREQYISTTSKNIRKKGNWYIWIPANVLFSRTGQRIA